MNARPLLLAVSLIILGFAPLALAMARAPLARMAPTPECGPGARLVTQKTGLSYCLYDRIRLPRNGHPWALCDHLRDGWLGFLWRMTGANRSYSCPKGARFFRRARHQGSCVFSGFHAPPAAKAYCESLDKGVLGYDWLTRPRPFPTPTPTPTPSPTPTPTPIPTPDPNATPDCSQAPGSLPLPALPAGTRRSDIPINHIVIIMQENRTFDNYFGALAGAGGYGADLDGQRSGLGNIDGSGNFIPTYHQTAACVDESNQQWNESHASFAGGTNAGFYAVDGLKSLGYYDGGDLPFIYAVANRFAIADRYFSSLMASTAPNRLFEMAATSFGILHNDSLSAGANPPRRAIFDLLNQYKISWKYYATDFPALALLPDTFLANPGHLSDSPTFINDARGGTLPEVSFVDCSQVTGTEYASYDHFVGNAEVEDKVRAILEGASWNDTVLFYTFDEGGGMYDHVVPPRACVPDSIPLAFHSGDVADQLDRYGFRVPFLAVSPYVKPHYVSHATYDHTSLLRFIETKFNLPALTSRDANALPLLELFDFTQQNLAVPTLPRTVVDPNVLQGCLKTVTPAP